MEEQAPPGLARIPLESDTVGTRSRGLPVLVDGAPVLLYTGKPKVIQRGHLAVGTCDLLCKLGKERGRCVGKVEELAGQRNGRSLAELPVQQVIDFIAVFRRAAWRTSL